jgi:hypothetical protein
LPPHAAGKSDRGAPLLYARLNGAGNAFEPQRNLMTTGRAPGVPVWSHLAAVAQADGTFVIFY